MTAAHCVRNTGVCFLMKNCRAIVILFQMNLPVTAEQHRMQYSKVNVKKLFKSSTYQKHTPSNAHNY